jgi:GntR family transcriptional regulator/MocR family aminotransferase
MRKVASGILPVIPIDRKALKPLHQQIYDGFRAAIIEGNLHRGQRIPSSRVLAVELGMSRFPVLNAYAQLLAEGYFESRVGAGTVISTSLPGQVTRSAQAEAGRKVSYAGLRPVARRTSLAPRIDIKPGQRGHGAFRVGEVAFDHFPLKVWTNLVARHCRKMNAVSTRYKNPMGSEAFRETIARYLRTARSLRCDASQIMIVNGSQQALEITARVLLDPGDRVWMEEPGYWLARSVFALAGCRLIPVPVDDQGMSVEAGIKLCRKARAAFVTPSHQFPLGVTMSASRRFQLLEWAHKTGSWIIEDDYDGEYRFESLPIASLHGLDTNARVIYIGTFSKVLFPSLRIGYVVIPADLVDQFRSIRNIMDFAPPDFFQHVIADFMDEGHFARHLRRMRVLYCEQRTALVESILKQLGSMVQVLGSEAGMHLSVALNPGVSDLEIAERAARENLWLWPLSPYYASKAPLSGFVLGFGGTRLEEISPAVNTLRKLLA